MWQLTALILTDTRVAEVRTFKGVTVRAASTLYAIAVKAEIVAHLGSWGQLHMDILAI